MLHPFRWAIAISFFAATCLATPDAVQGSALFAINASGPGAFVVVDAGSGNATPVDPDAPLGPESWVGLATIPGGDPNVAFALHNPRPPVFGDSPQSRLARIDTRLGTATLLPFFDVDLLGSPGPVSTAIAISPLEPGVATVAAFEFDAPGDRLLFKVSLDTGAVLGPALVLPERKAINALTYSPDGQTLYATDADGALATLNTTSGVLTRIGDPAGLSSFVTGLAFRPEDGALFAIDAGFNDRLVELDPNTGALVEALGRLGIGGPSGLAFAETESPAQPGDTNGDSRVDIADLNAVRNSFGTAGVGVSGDANGDALVNLMDLNLVRNHFGAGPGSPVPEPSGMVLAALLSMAAFAWKRCDARRWN
ncbi:MAG: hypothetical protein SGJ19_15375 [Planctomycetia bacterium]|nr:hypothetical protein [Planctomycetia bacterium]